MDTEELALRDFIRDTGWTIPCEAVIDTYRGRRGCGCGCRGTYSASKRAVTMRSRFVNESINDPEFGINHCGPSSKADGESVTCFSYEDDDTYVWVYVLTASLPVCNDVNVSAAVSEPAYAGSNAGAWPNP